MMNLFVILLLIIFRLTLARSTSVTAKEIDDLVVENNIKTNDDTTKGWSSLD